MMASQYCLSSLTAGELAQLEIPYVPRTVADHS
jgi:hypothetical protein